MPLLRLLSAPPGSPQPTSLLDFFRHGTAAFRSALSPYKFARWALSWDGPRWPQLPTRFVSLWQNGIRTAVDKVAGILLPSLIGESWRRWIAGAVVFVGAGRLAYQLAFWPSFLFYRGADRYGYLDRWKTLPQKRNPDTKLEDEIWEHVKHNVYRFPDVELIFWLLFYSRGEIALDVVPTLPGLLARMAFQTVVLDTIYYHFHRWEHSPGVYQRLHKRHHEMKVTNVYGHLVDSPEELLCLQLMTATSELVVAYTIGQNLLSSCAFTLFSISQDLHIHSGYTVPLIPYNWWNPQYYHNFHHSQNQGNYGAFFSLPLISWDWWMGTDKNWRRYRLAGDDVRKNRNTWPGFAGKQAENRAEDADPVLEED